MSIRAKRGTKAQIDAAATANGLKIGEILYATDTKKFLGATGAGAVTPLGSGEWVQIGSTQTASGKNTVTFSSIPARDELYIEVSGVTITTNGGADGYAIGLEFSTDGGTTYYGLKDGAGANITDIYKTPVLYGNESNSPAAIEATLTRISPSVITLSGAGINATQNFELSYNTADSSAPFGFLRAPTPITNLRVKSCWFISSDNSFTASNMTAGTIKLFGR